MPHSNIDFDRELESGRKSYNQNVGRWWRNRASDEIHAYAYRNIANRIADLSRKKSPVIIDYACGIGNLLTRLVRRKPHGRFIGYDASSMMLEAAHHRIQRAGKARSSRVRLISTQLPDFSLPRGAADIVVYCFPHIVSEDHEIEVFKLRYPRDTAVALSLTRSLQNSEYKLDTIEDKTVFESTLTERVVSRNLRSLLRNEGFCVRVDYAENEEVEVPAEIEDRISDFEDGTLNETVNGIKVKPFFESMDYHYFRSGVVLDVYEQTREERHLKGGYYFSVLRAI